MPEQPLRIRQAARALVITSDHAVLLCRFEFPSTQQVRTVWAVPGGGIEPGESAIETVKRELLEEVGLDLAADDVEVGPVVWTRRHIVPFIDGKWDGQEDRTYLVMVPARFEPTPALTWDELRAEHLHELRWCSIDEIAELSDPEHGVVTAPRRLAELLRSLRDDGVPSEPIDTGV